MNKNKKTLSSVVVTLGIIAMLVLIQPMAGLQVNFEGLPSSCNVNQEINFKAKITIQSKEWSNITSIKLIISKDRKTDVTNIPINLNPNAVVVQSKDLANTSSKIIEIKVDSETNAVHGYGYGYDYISENNYGYTSYHSGYGYGYGYGYITGYGYGYNVVNSPYSAILAYNITWKPESTGTYTIKLEVTVQKSDGEEITFTKEKTIDVKPTTSLLRTHHRSSGRGSSTSEETSEKGVVAKSEIRTQFEPGKPVDISLPWEKAKELGIIGLTLEYQQQVQAKVEIAKLAELPQTIEKPKVAKELYNIIEIKVVDENTGKYIEPKGWIKFMVSKKWLKEKGYSPDDVVMLRYHSGWEVLETKKLGVEDAENIYYKAYTPGFSIFAVAIKAAEEKKPTTEENTTTPTTEEGKAKVEQPTKPSEEKPTTEENTTTPTTEEGKGTSWTAIVIGLIILIIVGVGAYFYMGRKNE
jgi:PGF-pre-PGF domain-containing protein